MAPDGDGDLTDTVHHHRVGDADEYAYVAEDEGDTLTVWLYTRAIGFREIRELSREDFRAEGWERVDGLPDAILEQVSGDEVPYEPT
jgi:hypothetical protein